MKVLIAGGSGYVGCRLGNYLAARPSEFFVRSFDRLLYGPVSGLNFLNVQADIRSLEAKDIEGFDAVINLAGFSNDPTAEYNPEANMRLNTDAAIHFMEIAAEAGVKRYVFASSASVYDKCDEQLDASPDSELQDVVNMLPYSKSKVLAEINLTLQAAALNMSLVILRKGTIHGRSPRMRNDLIVNTMVGCAVTEGVVTCHLSPSGPMYRPIVDVLDVARAYKQALLFEAPAGTTTIFNIASENLSVTEIAASVLAAVSSGLNLTSRLVMEVIPKDQHTRSYRMNTNTAKCVLGWEPRLNLASSLELLVESTVTLSPSAFYDPRTRNIEWMKAILNIEETARDFGPLLGS